MQCIEWSSRLRVHGDGRGVIGHAGLVLPRLLADRVDLTRWLSVAMAGTRFAPLHDRGRVIVDLACAVLAGATAIKDLAVLRDQPGAVRVGADGLAGVGGNGSCPAEADSAGPGACSREGVGAGRSATGSYSGIENMLWRSWSDGACGAGRGDRGGSFR